MGRLNDPQTRTSAGIFLSTLSEAQWERLARLALTTEGAKEKLSYFLNYPETRPHIEMLIQRINALSSTPSASGAPSAGSLLFGAEDFNTLLLATAPATGAVAAPE